MAKTTLHISIPEPCHEDWSKMTPTQCGAFCNACQKEVVDFSQMSEAEIVAKLSTASGKVCGRIRADKLDRELVKYEPDHAWYSWKKWAVAAGVLLGIREAKANISSDTTKVIKQDSLHVKMQDVVVKPGHVWRCGPQAEPPKETPVLVIDKVVIKGRVLDYSNIPVANAEITFEHGGPKVFSNDSGEYSIELDKSFYNKTISITVSANDYMETEITTIVDYSNNIDLKMIKFLAVVVGGIDVQPVKAKRQGFFRRHND